MIVPTAAAWNTLATIERETREHEAGHAAAAHMFGFEVGLITLDRWADWGEFGSVRFKWSGTIDDEEEACARAVVAAAGPFVTDSWALNRSHQDRDHGRGGQVPGVVVGLVGVRDPDEDRATRALRTVPFASLAHHRGA